MAVKCPSCGTENQGGKFCAQCGSPLPQAPYGEPQAPYAPTPGMPPVPVPAKGGSRWWIWLVVGVVLFGGLAVGALQLLDDEPAVSHITPSSPTSPATPTTPAAPAKNQAAFALTKAAQGAFGKPYSLFSVSDKFIGTADGEEATLWEVDAKGQIKPIASVMDPDSGELWDVTSGMMGNGGANVMIATYEHKVHIASELGDSDTLDNDGVYQILIGDYDGDGKRETVYLSRDQDGKYAFSAYRYAPGQKTNTDIYARKGRTEPWPQLSQVDQKVGSKDYLYGYVKDEKGNYKLIRYRWDGALGPTAVNEYPIANVQGYDLYWLNAGFTPLGPSILAVRVGQSDATLEILTTKLGDFSKATSLGNVSLGNVAEPAVLIGKFMGTDYQIMVVDGTGAYTIYDVAARK